jgi:hypothetical protein
MNLGIGIMQVVKCRSNAHDNIWMLGLSQLHVETLNKF